MSEIFVEIQKNLISISFGLGLFALAYLSNMCLSIYYNVKILGEVFNKDLIKNSLLKIVAFVLGVMILVVVVTTLPMFAEHVGFELPDDFVNVFNTVAIVAVPLYASCRYAIKSFDKMQKVLGSKTSDGVQEYDDSKLYDNDEFSDASHDKKVESTDNSVPVYSGNTVNDELEDLAQIAPDMPDYSALNAEHIIIKNEESKNEVK